MFCAEFTEFHGIFLLYLGLSQMAALALASLALTESLGKQTRRARNVYNGAKASLQSRHSA